MFSEFSMKQLMVNGVSINFRIGGSGPGLLLLHGHPQTHVLWHKVASHLAKHFTVVAADLRGYGDSAKPPPCEDGTTYSKREMAKDMTGLMQALGFSRFRILAHDRGARVAHRLGVDHSDMVECMALLDIAPTLAMYEATNEEFARAYWHWFFLIRPAPLPERLIESDPEGYALGVMGARSAGLKPFTTEALAEYVRCLKLPGTAAGICGDYRASAGIDLLHDRKDIESRKMLTSPLLVLWGEHGIVGKLLDPLAAWRKVAKNVHGGSLPCGHYIAEENPEALLEAAMPFLQKNF